MKTIHKIMIIALAFSLLISSFPIKARASETAKQTLNTKNIIMPQGFVVLPNESLTVNAEDISGKAFSDEHFFLLSHETNLNLLIGFSTNFSTQEDQKSFQEIIDNPEEAALAFSGFYQSEKITKEQEVIELPILGEKQVTVSTVLEKTPDIPLALEIVAFEKQGVGIYIIHLYEKNSTELVALDRFAQNLSQSISLIKDAQGEDTVSPDEQQCYTAEKVFFNLEIDETPSCLDETLPIDGLIYSRAPELDWLSPGHWMTNAYVTNIFDPLPVKYEAVALEDMRIMEAVFQNIDFQTGDMDISEEELKAHGIEYKTLFAYSDVNSTSSEDINLIGYTQYITTADEIGRANVEDLKELLDEFATMVGAVNFREYDRAPEINTKELGPANSKSMIADINGQAYILEIAKFHRDGISIVLFVSRVRPSDSGSVMSSLFLSHVAKNVVNKFLFTAEFRKTFVPERSLSDDEIRSLPLPEVGEKIEYLSTPVDMYALFPDQCFAEVPDYTLTVQTEDLSGYAFSNYDPFIFIGDYYYKCRQDIYGFTTVLQTDEDKENFQAIIDEPIKSMEAFAKFYEATLKAGKDGKFYQPLGENQVDLNSMLELEDGTNENIDLVAFTKGDIGVYMLYKYSTGSPGPMLFPDFPAVLSRKMPANSLAPLPEEDIENAEEEPYRADWLEPGFSEEGYKPIELEDIGISLSAWNEAGFDETSLAIFHESQKEQTIIAYYYYFQTFEEIALFDEHYDIDANLEKIISLLDANIIDEYQRPDGAISNRDLRALLIEYNNRKYSAEILKKRTENIGFIYVILQHPTDNVRQRFEINYLDGLPAVRLIYTKPFRGSYEDKLIAAAELLQ